MMFLKLRINLACLALLAPLLVQAVSFDREQKLVSALGDLKDAPAWHLDDRFGQDDPIRGIYFDALPYKGKPTKVYALLGLPESAGRPVPGIVLVHGGGGSAFEEWVRKWNDAGFAAISIAVEGQTDRKDPSFKGPDNPQAWVPHEWAGPRRSGIYGDSDEPLEDQWMYHAVADTVLANSLLRSLPGVDAGKVGVMGISWGGVITSTVIGIDSRFAFAIPTYGCGHLSDAANQYGRALGENELYKQVWDPMVRIGNASMPTLWLSWPGDKHFPLDCQAECYTAMPGEAMVSLIPGMRHGHSAGWNPPDSYAFASSVVESGRSWCIQTSAEVKKGIATVLFESSRSLDSATLIWTRDSGITGDREWQETSAKLLRFSNSSYWSASASLPHDATAWFINVHSGDLTASSHFQEVDPDTASTTDRETWLFLGDSITMAGHYVDYIESWLLLNDKYAPEIIDLGLSSETVSCLSEPDHPYPRPCVHSRLEAFLDHIKPDRVFACYGMNCAIYHPFSEDRFAAYKEGILKLVNACGERGAEVILVTPPPYAGRVMPKDPPADGQPYGYKTPTPDYNEVLQRYADWILSLDGKDGIESINIRPGIERFMEACYPKEPVHPNNHGHELMGEAILRGLGYDTGSNLLESGENPWNEDSQWTILVDLINQQRMAYDRSLLNALGHGNPSVMKRETLSLGQAFKQSHLLDIQIEALSKP